jgi:Cu(I)/Ag(I) efflux system membrane protein CusA/SilA
VPIRIGDVAKVNIGPATRRGILDKSGAEAVGGVVVARYGANPLEVIKNVKDKIAEIEPGLATKILADGTISQVNIIPFYDRTTLINETIGTLQEALSLEILITVIVVILMLLNLKSSILVAISLPIAVLMCFIAMKIFNVDANIVALSGIAIAIGTMVDMGIVLMESMVTRINEQGEKESLFTSIYEATIEVAGAVITAVATTVISFIPIFTMEAAEGKLFRPLAYTKTFALVAAVIVAIAIIPPLAHTIFGLRLNGFKRFKRFKLINSLKPYRFSKQTGLYLKNTINIVLAISVTYLLAIIWMPLGVTNSELTNFLFLVILVGSLIGFFYVIIHFYEKILRFLLQF